MLFITAEISKLPDWYVSKMIMKIGQTLKNQILIIDLLNLNFRKVRFNRK